MRHHPRARLAPSDPHGRCLPCRFCMARRENLSGLPRVNEARIFFGGAFMSREKLLALAAFLGMTAGVTGCNTMEGAGRDVEGAGEAVQDASNDVQDEIEEEKND